MASFSFSFLQTLSLFLCLSFFGHNLVIAHQIDAPPPAKHDLNIAHQIGAPPPANFLIPVACQRALHKQFCINIFTSVRNTAKLDLKGLALIALKIAEKNATATTLFIKQSLNKPGLDFHAELQQALTECSEQYIAAVELIEDAISALFSNDVADLNRFVKAAVADIDSCNASIKDYDVVAPVLTEKNAALRRLFNTALDVAHVATNYHH